MTVSALQAPRQLILRKFILKSGLSDLYDTILIDGPPTLGLLFVNILCATDGLIIPFRPDQFSRGSLKTLLETVDQIEEMELTPRPKIVGLIPNLYEKRRKQATNDLAQILEEMNEYDSSIHQFHPLENKFLLDRCTSMKKTVFDYDGKDYSALQELFLTIAKRAKEVLK